MKSINFNVFLIYLNFYVRNYYYPPHNPNKDNNKLVANFIVNLLDNVNIYSNQPANEEDYDRLSDDSISLATDIYPEVIENRIKIYKSNSNNQNGN